MAEPNHIIKNVAENTAAPWSAIAVKLSLLSKTKFLTLIKPNKVAEAPTNPNPAVNSLSHLI
jgi:hypothetical protein